MKWTDVISATHGVFFTSPDQVQAWEAVVTKAIPDLKKGEIEKALYEAMDRDDPHGFRVTARDVIRWVRHSRSGWDERQIVRDGRVYFPDREKVCGQMQSRKL